MRDDSKPDVSPSCGPFPLQRIVTVSFSPSYVGLLNSWFVVSTKFLVDDDVVVEATESDAAVSWITDVSMAQQLGKPFALMDNNSLLVDFDGQVRREGTVDHRALGGDRDWAERASKTDARICTPESCCTMASPCSKGLVSVRRRNAT